MTLAEILKANGVDDEVVNKIAEEMKTNKIYTSAEENIDIRYGKLKTDHEGVTKQLGEANALIEELKKSNKGNEGLQQQISGYETQVAQLEAELTEARTDAAMDRKLIAAGAKAEELDYLKFQWRKKGELALDENGEIKGGDDAIAGLKTQRPTSFTGESRKEYVENTLPTGENAGGGITKESLLKMPYSERMKIYNENTEAYRNAMNN